MRGKLLITALLLCCITLTACTSEKQTSTSDKQKEKSNTSQKTSEGSTSSSEIKLDLAKLLTKEDAEEALGEKAANPNITDTHNPMGQKIISYHPATGTSMHSVQLSVIQNAWFNSDLRATGYSVKKLQSDGKAQVPTAQEIPGIGDAAYWNGNLDQVQAGIRVLKGNVHFSVNVWLGDNQKAFDEEKKLAAKIAARLP